jgi:hypothetical protein
VIDVNPPMLAGDRAFDTPATRRHLRLARLVIADIAS